MENPKNRLSPFWKGFICGGIAVPAFIVAAEIAYKLIVHGEIAWK